MNIMYNLTDRYGPRLTNSPQFRARGRLGGGPAEGVGLEQRSSGEMVHRRRTRRPDSELGDQRLQRRHGRTDLHAADRLSAGMERQHQRPVTGEAMLANIQTPADLDKWHGKLKGKIVFLVDPLDLPFPDDARWHAATPMKNWPRWFPRCSYRRRGRTRRTRRTWRPERRAGWQ